MYSNLKQLDWAEEYLILLNNVSIQCRFQERQLIEASRQRNITREEHIISNEISRAFEKLVVILYHAHRSLERLKSVSVFFGTLYIAAEILCFSA